MGPVADQQSDLRPVPEKHPRRRKLAHEPLRFRPAAEQPQVGGRAQPEASERPPSSLTLLQPDGKQRLADRHAAADPPGGVHNGIRGGCATTVSFHLHFKRGGSV